MKTVKWEGKGKVLEVQNSISNPGLEGQIMETKQEEKKKSKHRHTHKKSDK